MDGKEANSSDVSAAENSLFSVKDVESYPTEIVVALVGALGVDHAKIRGIIADRLQAYNYKTNEIRISNDIICKLANINLSSMTKYERAKELISKGNDLRDKTGYNEILATATAARISELRGNQDKPERLAFVISSLKHPEEVAELRRIYGKGFFLFSVHRSKGKRVEHLIQNGGMTESQAESLIKTDKDEAISHGQHLRDTFHLADFFLNDEGLEDKLKYAVERCLDLVFGKSTITPTFNEFAMYMAFASSLRSADLSRQVGAVIARDNQILSTGANDCPAYGGGLYWPRFNEEMRIADTPEGRDLVRTSSNGEDIGFDSNTYEKTRIINKILADLGKTGDVDAENKLRKGPIGDITEYGRVVHAEMEALLACARSSVSSKDATIFCTTFPCHNCAKHIIASGITQVVFVEPYPKSLALNFHPDSAVLEEKKQDRVRFKPFVGVGPRRYFDLFSISMGEGRKVKRKNKDGTVRKWNSRESLPRLSMRPLTYKDLEDIATQVLQDATEEITPKE